MMNEQLQLVPVEEQINQELVKANVTETIINTLKEKYLLLKISGIDDKETYLTVKEARKECKALRVLAEKICKKGREEAVAIQKAWVAKEKDVTGQIAEVEDYLEKQEKDYETQVAAEKERRKREQEEQLIRRQQELSAMNVLYADGKFSLGEVSFELSIIKECDSDIWENDIKPKFEEEFKKVEAERLEQERIQREKEAELKRQQEELEQQRQELERQKEEMRKAQEEQDKKKREEEERKISEEKAKAKIKFDARCNDLTAIGFIPKWPHGLFTYDEIIVNEDYIKECTDAAWNETIEEIRSKVEIKKIEAEQRRLSEIEQQKEIERKRTLGFTRFQALKAFDYTEISTDVLAETSEEQWAQLHEEIQIGYNKKQREKWEKEQDEKRQQEEADRMAKLESAKDKEKWDEMCGQVHNIEVFQMRSSQYRTKAQKFREKLEELKSICNG